MDPSTIISIASTGAALVSGGWFGARYGKQQALADAANNSSLSVDVISTLQAKVELLASQNRDKENNLVELLTRVEVLESLVTQRAEVEAVHQEVTEVKTIVTRIADKVGA